MSLRILDGTPDDEGFEVTVTRTVKGATVFVDGVANDVRLSAAGRAFELSVEDRTERVWVAIEGDTVYVHAFGRAHRLEVIDPEERSAMEGDQTDTATAPTPGTVVSVAVDNDAAVAKGDILLVFESMKMQSEIVAWRDGTVERVHQRVGDTFNAGAPLVSLLPEEETPEEDA